MAHTEKRIFNHSELEEEIRLSKASSAYNETRFKKSKHSLDSDEEDEDENAQKYNVLDPNEFEGEEEKTIEFDGEIKITPFNMKEELEEGYFDKEGTYIFEKDNEDLKDQWLEDIDWKKVKSGHNIKRKQKEINDEEINESLPSVNLIEHYTKMLELMKPKETVQKAICRFGGKKSISKSASNRWKKKKDEAADQSEENEEENENRQNLLLLTSLANDIVQAGDLDIYQQSYEKLSFYIKSAEETKNEKKVTFESNTDMFGDEFEEKVENKTQLGQKGESSSDDGNLENEVMWEFKWDSSDESKIYGPYPTSQMLQWVQEKYFEDGVFVRQISKQDGQFYNSNRIDFELYL